MKDILNSNQSDDIKAKLYDEALQKSLLFTKKMKKTPEVIVKEKKRPLPESEILKGIPMKKKSKKMVDTIREAKNAIWDDQGRFVFDGQAIPSSSVKELIKAAVKKPNRQLSGWKEFQSVAWEHV